MNEQQYLREMLGKLLSQSEDTQKSITSLDKKVDLHIQKTELQLDQIHKLDQQQNEILEEHHQRSTELKRDNEIREKVLRKEIEKIEDRLEDKATKTDLIKLDGRLDKVEKPREWLKSFIKALVTIGTIAGTIYSIYQYFK